MLTDEQDKSKIDAQNDPIEDHYDREFAGIADNYEQEASHPLGDKESVANAEKQSESNSPKSGEADSPEKSWYNNSFGQSNGSLIGRAKTAFTMASNKKKAAGAGGIIGIIVLVIAFFTFISTFQLIHMAEMLNNVFDAQTSRVLNKRAAKHYAIIFDEDGNGYYKKNKPVTGRITKGYSSLNAEKLRLELSDKYNITVGKDGRFRVNGEIVEGKLSDQRNRLSQILGERYPQDGWVKRNIRSKTAFKAMGIQRVFFFENTQRKINNWELEMISRMRERLGISDGSSKITIDNSKNENGPTEVDSEQAAELAKKLEDPEFDPGADTKTNIPAPDVDTGKIFDAAGKSVSATGIADGACEIKYVLKGTELLARSIRYSALVKNAGAIMVASHQLKTGESVSAAQVGALMTIVNRDPGIGASGSYQLLSGNPDGAKKVNTDKFGLKFTSGTGGILSNANQKADEILSKIPGGNGYCKLSRNVFYQIGSTAAGVAITIGGSATGVGIGAVAAKAAAQAAIWFMVGQVVDYVKNVVANDLAGPAAILHYAPSQGGDDSFDALAGGSLAMSSGSRYQEGMTQALSKQDVAEIESQIAYEKTLEQKDKSVFDKYFALSNYDSSLSKYLATMPSTPNSAAKSTASSLTSLPKKFANALILLSPAGNAKAAATTSSPNAYIAANPLNIPMYGMTDKTIDRINKKYDVGENENWIANNGGFEEYENWKNECYPTDENGVLMSYGVAIDEDQENTLKEMCTNLDNEKYERYATYRMDRSIQQSVFFMSGVSDCTDPESDDIMCTDPDLDGGTTTEPGDETTGDGAFIMGDYAWPVGIFKKDLGTKLPCQPSNCHHDNTPAFDLSTKDTSKAVGKPIYAITDGEMWLTKIHKGLDGCYNFHIKGNDGYDYFYGHTQNPIITGSDKTKKVKKGDKVAEIGTLACGDNTIPHLHIDQSKEYGHSEAARTDNLVTVMNKLYEKLPDEAPPASGEAANKDGWVWPIKGASKSDLGSKWGDANRKGTHLAIDIGGVKGSKGSSVLAAHDGTVVESYWSGGCGYFYLIKATGTDYWMAYQHLANLPSNKKKGDAVQAGEKIGEVGTYCGTGYHLHFGIEKKPKISFYGDPKSDTIDPLEVLP